MHVFVSILGSVSDQESLSDPPPYMQISTVSAIANDFHEFQTGANIVCIHLLVPLFFLSLYHIIYHIIFMANVHFHFIVPLI